MHSSSCGCTVQATWVLEDGAQSDRALLRSCHFRREGSSPSCRFHFCHASLVLRCPTHLQEGVHQASIRNKHTESGGGQWEHQQCSTPSTSRATHGRQRRGCAHASAAVSAAACASSSAADCSATERRRTARAQAATTPAAAVPAAAASSSSAAASSSPSSTRCRAAARRRSMLSPGSAAASGPRSAICDCTRAGGAAAQRGVVGRLGS